METLSKDIRTNEENEILGDTITSFIREKAADIFFYKPKKDKIADCKLPYGTIKKLSTKYARIELAELH